MIGKIKEIFSHRTSEEVEVKRTELKNKIETLKSEQEEAINQAIEESNDPRLVGTMHTRISGLDQQIKQLEKELESLE